MKDQSSVFGVSGHGKDNEFMMAWADKKLKLKVVRSSGSSFSWHWRNPPETQVSGTPSILKLDKDTWVLAYPKFSEQNLGKIYARISTDDGKTWSNEYNLLNNAHSLFGVSLAAIDNRRFLVAITRASGNGTTASTYGSPLKAEYRLNSNNTLRAYSTTSFAGFPGTSEINIAVFKNQSQQYDVIAYQQLNSRETAIFTQPINSGAARRNILDSESSFAAPAISAAPDKGYVTVYQLNE